MNYILTLKGRALLAEKRLENASLAIAEFQVHLASPKFQGHDPDGQPRAWIATADVRARLEQISAALHADLQEPEPDTSDIPEVPDEFFRTAKLVLPTEQK